jgi:hypothetical protein
MLVRAFRPEELSWNPVGAAALFAEAFYCFLKSLEENAGIVHKISQKLLPSTFLPEHYSVSIIPFDAAGYCFG